MRILVIRHGDPDYVHDDLTEKGQREAALLAERLERERVTKVYVSPLGRARATCRPFCERAGITPVVLNWLTEFDAMLHIPEVDCPVLAWNLQPERWTSDPRLYGPDWAEASPYRESEAPARYAAMGAELDALLLTYGYRHAGGYFTREADMPEQDETIALFCHQGAGQVVLSLLTGTPLPVFLHTFFLPTTSVSTVFLECWSEERRAYLARVIGLGDLSHLYAGGEPTAFAGLRGTPWFNAVAHKNA